MADGEDPQEFAILESAQRAQLSAVQTRSTSFRGFTEEELDTLFPFLSMIEVPRAERHPKCELSTYWPWVRFVILSFRTAIRS